MMTAELAKLGYEVSFSNTINQLTVCSQVWQPPLGGAGVMEHNRRPDLFLTPAPYTTCSTPAASRSNK